MKVRLKQLVATSLNGVPMFQFHEGPIKTRICANVLGFDTLFQFHEGPIKTYRLLPCWLSSYVSIP